jgi:hypothetical protein
MSDELSELQENAEHGRENPSLAPISVTMAILAVCVAVVSLLGHRSHTEELLFQNRATDQWAYFQAKNIRRHNYEMSLDLLALIEFKDKEQAAKIREKYEQEAERYAKEQDEIEKEAKDLESESARAERKADRFDLGEVFLEIALVISSLAQACLLVSGNHLGRLWIGDCGDWNADALRRYENAFMTRAARFSASAHLPDATRSVPRHGIPSKHCGRGDLS